MQANITTEHSAMKSGARIPTTRTAGLASGLAGSSEQDRLLEMQRKEVQSLRKALGKIAHQTYYLLSFLSLKKKKNVKLKDNCSTSVSSFFFLLILSSCHSNSRTDSSLP